MEARELIFFAGSAICVPLGILMAGQSRRMLDLVFFVLVFGTCMPETFFGVQAEINFFSKEWYRGSTRGLEFSYLDLLGYILLFASLKTRKKEGIPFFWLPGLVPMLVFLGWCVVTVAAFSDPKIFGVFEAAKVARAIVLFIAVGAYLRSPRELRLLVWALAGTVFYITAYSLRDRYIFGYNRIRATFGHPNSLSMYSLQCVPIFIVAIFAVDVTPKLRYASMLAYSCAATCVLLTISRTGFLGIIVLSVAGFLISVGFRINPRNLAIAFLGLVVAAGLLAKSYDSIMSRLGGFNLEQEYSSEGDRGSYFRQAEPALRDNPVFGIGLNNWSWWISNLYGPRAGYDMAPYLSMDSAPVVERAVFPSPPAHNLYLLTFTELGYPGGILFLALLLYWLRMACAGLFAKGETLLVRFHGGVLLSLGGVLIQSWTEWEFRQTSMFFLGHIVMAASAVLFHHRRDIYRA